MQKMLVCGVLALVACGGGQKPAPEAPAPSPVVANAKPAEPTPPKSEAGQLIDQMNKFTDEMCACADAACAQKVSDEMVAWSQDLSKKYENNAPPPMTEDETKQAQDIGMRMGNCMQKAMGMASSSSGSGSGGGSGSGSGTTP